VALFGEHAYEAEAETLVEGHRGGVGERDAGAGPVKARAGECLEERPEEPGADAAPRPVVGDVDARLHGGSRSNVTAVSRT